MTKRNLAAALTVLPLLAVAAAGAEPPPPVPVDLGSPQQARIPQVHEFLEPHAVTETGGKPGWAVRLDRCLPPDSPRDPRLLVTPGPLVSGGRVFTGGGFFSRALFALDGRTGRHLWTADLEDNGPSKPTLTPHGVVTDTESCTAYSLDPGKGKTRWKELLGPSLPSPPASAGRRIFTCLRKEDGSYAFAALDSADGGTVWETPVARETVGTPLVAQDRVFLTLATRHGLCLDARTGRVIWDRDLLATGEPELSGGSLFFATLVRGRSELVRVDARDGDVLWTSHADPLPGRADAPAGATYESVAPRYRGSQGGWGDEPPRPVVMEPTVVLAADRDIVVYDAENGEVLRRFVLPEGRQLYAPPARIGKNLLYATTDGLLFEFDPRTGGVRRSLDLCRTVTASPVLDDGRVYLTSVDLVLSIPWPER